MYIWIYAYKNVRRGAAEVHAQPHNGGGCPESTKIYLQMKNQTYVTM